MDYLKLKEQYETGKFAIEYKPKSEEQWKRTDDIGVFFLSQDEWDVKLVEKDKPSLNGHYCLATKEHYDKLVEDECVEKSFGKILYSVMPKYFVITDDIFHKVNSENFHSKTEFYDSCGYKYKPMHLHNNEWQFGSLEHEESELEKSYNDAMLNGNSMMCVSVKGFGHIPRDEFEKTVNRKTYEIGETILDTCNNRTFKIGHIGKHSVYNETKTMSCKFEKVFVKGNKQKPFEHITMADHADSLHTTIVTSSRDWSLNKRDAWLYGIIIGWDDKSLKELSLKYRWHIGIVERLKLLHKEYLQANKKDNN